MVKVSVVIPVYNEEAVIADCLASLGRQTIAGDLEIIVVDDGSTDGSKLQGKIQNLTVLGQNHLGPGAARNLGAARAKGDILVFVDADMEFAPDFVEKLIAPIKSGKAVGTYSQEEYLLNKSSPLARCWNLNLGRQAEKMEPRDFEADKNKLYSCLKNIWQKIEKSNVEFAKDQSHVFRAIAKDQFLAVGGFDTDVGYTDDWSVSRKLGILAVPAPQAKYYHRNPDTLREVWMQARWFGKNEFLTKNLVRKVYNLWRYFPPFSVIKGLMGTIKFQEPAFFSFKIVYDTAVFTSVLLSFVSRSKAK